MNTQETGWLSLYYGYLDESGDVAPFSGSRYLIVSALLTGDPRPIELHVKRARTAMGRKARPDELRASTLDRHVIARLLHAIAQEEIEIHTAILDKSGIVKPPPDPEEMYRETVTQVVRACVVNHPRLQVWFDKRYTNPMLRERLERTVRDGIADVARQAVVIHQEDSQKQRGLQAADHVAWAFHQKYEHGDDGLYQILAHKVVFEKVTSREPG